MRRCVSYCRRLAGSAVFMISMVVLPAANGDLVSHWSFDTNLSDLSGNGNHGTSVNGAVVSSAYSAFGGGSLYLDGVNKAYVQTGNPGLQTSSFTIAAWVRPEVLENDWTDIYGYWSNSGGNNYPFAFYMRSDNKLCAYFRPHIDLLPSTQTYSLLNTWNHVAVTWDRDAKTMQLYVNGELAAAKSTTAENVDMQASVSGWTIGRKDDSTTPYRGYIDELWVFNEALSADGINYLMTQNVPEPSMLVLLLAGLAGLATRRPRRQ